MGRPRYQVARNKLNGIIWRTVHIAKVRIERFQLAMEMWRGEDGVRSVGWSREKAEYETSWGDFALRSQGKGEYTDPTHQGRPKQPRNSPRHTLHCIFNDNHLSPVPCLYFHQ